VFSPRGAQGACDVRDQPPEFWDHFNASPPPGTHLRVHPILHWTESDRISVSREWPPARENGKSARWKALHLAHGGSAFLGKIPPALDHPDSIIPTKRHAPQAGPLRNPISA
jgi:hypothetical protein